ncbi:MAG: SCP2 sterol-binding domain-containing protein [Gammaproteobacteria bacterium]|nr:SCP2 sterol-binding domain-containing protein [Gammaproteobacteria bacterium]MCW5582654.1 SCP2 sterol-binding domain-containing protein [Gammaproteobacteria bacterium]
MVNNRPNVMKTMILQSLTKAVNTYLNLDPESKQRLKKLRGKAITIELLPFHFVFQCIFTDDHIHLQANETLTPDTILRGTPMQMLGVMIAKDNRQSFFANDLTMEGNAELGQDVVELFDSMQIDGEEYLSHFVGDIPAYHTNQFIKRMTGWLNIIEQSVTENLNEYIHEETQWLPTPEALQDFYDDIDTLRMDVDRIEASITHLQTEFEEKQ